MLKFSRLRAVAVVIAAVVLSASLSACGGAKTGASKSGDYKIGFISSLSGPVATAGLPGYNGFKNYIGTLNAKGGVNGHKIQVLGKDDHYDPSTGLAAYRELVSSDNVLAVFGLVGSNVASTVQNSAGTLKTAVIAQGGAGPFGDYAFGGDEDQTAALTLSTPLVKHLMGQGGLTSARVATIAVDSVAGHASSDAFAAAAKSNDLSVSNTIFAPASISSFSTEATQIASGKPDFVIVAVGTGVSLVVGKALRQAGVTVPIMNYWAASGQQVLKQLDDPNVYAYRDFADPSEDVAADMRANARAQGIDDGTSSSIGPYYTWGYVMGELVENVLKQCGADCTPAKFNDKLLTASHIDSRGLTAPGVGYTESRRFFLPEVLYYSWDKAAGRSVPVAGMTHGGLSS